MYAIVVLGWRSEESEEQECAHCTQYTPLADDEEQECTRTTSALAVVREGSVQLNHPKLLLKNATHLAFLCDTVVREGSLCLNLVH